MKALVKLGFAVVVMGMLAGCGLPKVEDKVEKGIIEKSVDIRGMKQEWREWTVENYKFKMQVFVDANGQYYDEDGVKATQEGYRILKDGQVCKPTGLGWGWKYYDKIQHFGDLDVWSCFLDARLEGDESFAKTTGMASGAGMLAGAAGIVAGIAAAKGSDAISGSTMFKQIEKFGYISLGKVE